MSEANTIRTPFWTPWHGLSLGIILLSVVALELFLPPSRRVATWLSILTLMAVFGVIVGHGITGRWLGVLINPGNQVSLSRLQLLLWTLVLLSGFLTAVAANIDAGLPQPLSITIPAELWVLMGISTASMVGSPLIQSVKRGRAVSDEAKQQALAQVARRSRNAAHIRFQGQMVVNQSVESASIADIFQGSEANTLGFVDVGQMQMAFFTLILVFAYGAALAGLFSTGEPVSSLPGVDAGMLALLGISHAGFLANKALQQKSGASTSNTVSKIDNQND